MADEGILTPVGRIVQGDLWEPSSKDYKGNQKTNGRGEPISEYFIGVAFAKNDPAVIDMLGKIQTKAQALFPNGEWQDPQFKWKYKDCDADAKTAQQPHLQGHYVLRLVTQFPIGVYDASNQEIINRNAAKRGDYARVYFHVSSNGQPLPQAGVMLFPDMVQIVQQGEAIKTGPSAEQIFGAAAPQAPQVPQQQAPQVPQQQAPQMPQQQASEVPQQQAPQVPQQQAPQVTPNPRFTMPGG